MSSSSATGATTSRSPSPSTPEATDNLDPVVIQTDGDYSWGPTAQPPLAGGLPWSSGLPLAGVAPASKVDGLNMLAFNELIQEDAFDESMPSGYNSSAQAATPSFVNGLVSDLPAATPSIADFLSQLAAAAKPDTTPSSPAAPMESAATTHNTVYPPKDTCTNLPIVIPNIPEHGVKSRVETQIRFTVDLAYASSSTDNSNYDRVGNWKWLKLPKGTSTKKRTRKEGKIAPATQDMLFLGVDVLCASPPHTRVVSCQSCQAREAKRVARKVAARIRPPRSDSELPEDVKAQSKSKSEDTTSIIQFNCPEIVDFSTGSAVLPVRITCYCRHHREKVGFRVQLTMFDETGRLIGTGTSGPIMITDDHKSTGAGATKKVAGGAETPGARREGATQAPRKRPKPYDAARPPRSKATSQPPSTPPSVISSLPVTRSGSPSQPVDPALWMQEAASMVPELPWDPATSLPSPVTSHMSPEPAEAQPVAIANPMPLPLPLQRPFMLFGPDGTLSLAQLPPPVIHRLVPGKGPICGGTEVTILGNNFHASMDLKCVFGDVIATSTQRWSDNTLVCVVPPRMTAGVVPVWLEGVEKPADAAPAPLFTYEDESDRALMELALQVLGLKLTGKVEDPKNVALRIVGNAGPSSESQSTTNSSHMMQVLASDVADPSRGIGRFLLGGTAQDPAEFEKAILRVLSLLDVVMDQQPSVTTKQAISYQTHSGQTLLHLSVALDLTEVVSFLVEHEIDLDMRDRNGWTALHFAASGGAKDSAQILVAAGADLKVVNARGQAPRELAPRGFFEGMHHDVETEPEWNASDGEDEDASMGDVEDSGDEARVRRSRRRAGRRRQEASATSHQPAEPLAERNSSDDGAPPYATPSMSEKEPTDEKHAAASYADLIQRTLAQLQRSKGMIPGMPHLANLPGMRAVPWSALPQIPMVFPVFVPTPAWPAFLEKRTYSSDSAAEGDTDTEPKTSARRPVTAAVRAANEWIAFWEKLMAQGMAAAGTGSPKQEVEEVPPPVYTPRAEPAPEAGPATSVEERAVSRRKEYRPSSPVPEQVVDAYEYRPAKKSPKLLQKDRMLILFWIPMLFAGFMWAFLTAISVALQGMKTIVAVKTGIQL